MRDAEIRFVSVNWVKFLVRVEPNAHFAGSERSPRKDAVCLLRNRLFQQHYNRLFALKWSIARPICTAKGLLGRSRSWCRCTNIRFEYI